jgi:hypothetical protein
VRKACQVWLGSHDTPSDIHDFGLRSTEIFSYCKSRKTDKSVLITLVCTCDITRGHSVCYNITTLTVVTNLLPHSHMFFF